MFGKIFRNKSYLDLFWSFSDNLSQQLINFIVGIILARILLPEEFGLIGIVSVLIAISSVLVDSGFSSALINRKEINDVDCNTVFITNISISSFLYLILFFTSDWIASFFDNPEISKLIKILGINLILISLSSIHRTIIVRNLNFKLITIISLVAVSISAISAIYMAYNGFGVYSLVYRILIGQLITVILFWIFNNWKPRFSFSIKSFKEMFSYGINLLASNLLNTLHSNVYYIIIGKFFSPADLGYYTRATTFRDLASTNISNTIKRVSFSTLSKIHDEKEQLKKFNFYSHSTYLITSLAMLFIFFQAKEIILILLSEKWIASIEILQILTVSGVFIALYNLNLDYLAVIGRTKLYLGIEVIGKILILPIIAVAYVYGIKYFLYAIIVQNFIMYIVVTTQLNKLKKGIIKKQTLALLKFIVMLIVLIAINYFNLINYSNIYISFICKSLVLVILFTLLNLDSFKLLKRGSLRN